MNRRSSNVTPFENLESRCLLSADPAGLATKGFEQIQWQGQTVWAKPNQWIGKFEGLKGTGHKPLNMLNGALSKIAKAGFKAVEQLSKDGLMLIDAPAGKQFNDVKQSLSKVSGFKLDSVEPDFALWADTVTPNDTYYNSTQWALNNTGQTGGTADADIDAPEAWSTTTGTGNVVVGIVDTGIDYTHADLASNVWHNPGEVAGNGVDDDRNGYVDDVYGWDFYNNDNNPMDDAGHGTHVAGTIAAVGNNGVGVAGIAWNAKVMALKFLGADGSGSASGALAAINYANKMRTSYGINVRVLNNSWGGGGFSSSLQTAIQNSANAGILFVAAAGNGGTDGIGDNNNLTPQYPADYNSANVISVAATDKKDALASFSNYGATAVDLAAPGVDIASTAMGGGYVYMSGTSMATPHVSGVAALAFSYNPSATYTTVKNAILNGVDKISSLTGKVVSGGRLNAYKTLLNMPAPVTAVPAPPSALSAAAKSQTQVNLNWTDNSNNETGFRVERSSDGVSFSQVATVSAGVTTFSDTGRSASTTYTYRVLAYNTSGNSAYSNAASATTLAAPVDVALGKTATQSSTGWGGLAARAVDGNTDGDYYHNSVSHSDLETQPSWQVDLGGSANIDTIELWNRTDGVSDRLSDFYVLVSDAPFASNNLADSLAQAGVSSYHVSAPPSPNTSLAIGRSGRYVRVQLNGTSYLSLAEVKVMGQMQTVVQQLQDIAIGKTTSQSSTGWGGNADRAVDGNTDGNFYNNSVTHTDLEAQPWWQVDLGASAAIDNVEVWNRTDGVSVRLADFYVLVSDTPFVSSKLSDAMAQAGVSSYHVKDIPSPSTTVAVGRSGRYVRVQLAGTSYLSLAEVRVMGTASPVGGASVASSATGAFSTTRISSTDLHAAHDEILGLLA